MSTKKEKHIEEAIIHELGETARAVSGTGANLESIIKKLNKHESWFRQVAERIKQQEQIIQKLLGKSKITVIPKATPDEKAKPLKCNGCGAILLYALDDMCPVCGSKDIGKAV